MEKHYLSSSDLSDVGIIFITSNDPVSRIIISITKQEFSSIGFFYRTSATGTSQIRVVSVDIFGMRTPEWLRPRDTLEDLINNPLISQIAIKKLKNIHRPDGSLDEEKTRQLHTNFRTAIAQVMGMKGEMSMRDSIAQIFGYDLQSAQCNPTAVEMVNKVIKLIGRWNDVPHNDSVSASALDLLTPPEPDQTNYKSKVQLMGYLSSTLNANTVSDTNQTKQIQSYIVDNNLFDGIIYISLPPRNSLREEIAIAESIVFYRPYLSRAITTFIDMLLMDENFFKIVISGIKRGRIREELDFQTLNNFMGDLHMSHAHFLSVLLKSLEEGHLPKEEVTKLLKDHESNASLIKMLNQENIKSNLPQASQEDKVVFYGQSPEVYHQAIKDIHTQLSQGLQSMESGQMLYFDLNRFIDSINQISKMSGNKLPTLTLPTEETSYSAIVGITRNRDEKVPIKLQSGDSIHLPLINPDLQGLNRSTLLEILQYLDAHPYYEHKYDHLRSKIACELSK